MRSDSDELSDVSDDCLSDTCYMCLDAHCENCGVLLTPDNCGLLGEQSDDATELERDWIEVGGLWVPSGTLVIGDLFCKASDSHEFEVPNEYHSVFVELFSPEIARLRISVGEDGKLGDEVAVVVIDTNTLTIRDKGHGNLMGEFVPYFSVITGWGDGFYPVYEVIKDGRRVGIEVVFIPDVDEECD